MQATAVGGWWYPVVVSFKFGEPKVNQFYFTSMRFRTGQPNDRISLEYAYT